MEFFTRQDDLRFRRTTWLLSKLQVTVRPAHIHDDPHSSTTAVIALQQLCSLANLLVRKHEIVAVIPTDAHRQPRLYVAAQEIKGPLSSAESYVTRNLRRDTDIRPDFTRFNANVVSVTHEQPPSPTDPIPADADFLLHVKNVFSFLKEAANLKLQLNGMEEHDDEYKPSSNKYQDLVGKLERYITRTCFEKISKRAGYHCPAAVRHDKEDGEENQRERCSSKSDFTSLLYPLSSWNKAHMKILKKSRNKAFSGIYESTLIKEPFSFDMNKLFKDKKEERAKHDPNMWTDAQWTDAQWTDGEPLHSDLVRDYALGEEEQLIWKELEQAFDLGPIPQEEGFYLTANGRRAYHQLVTTCVWNALFYLNLLNKRQAAVANAFPDSSTAWLTAVASSSLHQLEILAYRSPILGIHLDWLYQKQPNNKRKSVAIEQPIDSDILGQDDDDIMGETDDNITGEGADIVPSLKQMVLHHDRKGAKEPSSSFLVHRGRAAAVLRWLRLITLHQSAIWSLLRTSTVEQLAGLSLNLVQTTIPCDDKEMESLESYLSSMKFPLDSHDIGLFVEVMQRQGKKVDDFQGTYHCEAVLLSLYLLHHETRKQAAGNFFPKVVAVSKRCCPVCNQLFQAVHKILGIPYTIIGTHAAYSACALPPFLPKQYAQAVADALEKRLAPALGDYMARLHDKEQIDRGSASPAYHPEPVQSIKRTRGPDLFSESVLMYST